MRTVYLAGPINGCTDEECNDWRKLVTSLFPDGYQAVDPMARDYRGREHRCTKLIVEGDKRDIDHCDVVIVNFPKPSVGTSMEIFYAWTQGKPVIVVCPKDAVVSPWMAYHSTAIAHSYTEALELIQMLPCGQ